MKTICDLPVDLLEDEIFSRLPMTSLRSVRSTCKKWNILCKNRIFFGKAKKQFLMMDSSIRLMNFDLSKDSDPSVEQVSSLDQIQISKAFHYDGLLLCVLKDRSRLVLWNPYLGQTRWIEPRISSFQRSDIFALGYDNNLNHKILRISSEMNPVTSELFSGFELYDFSSSSWKVIDVTPEWEIRAHRHSVSLKGNAYFPAHKNIAKERIVAGFFVCFDFTTESFGPLLPLPPSHSYRGIHFVSFSCVRQEQQLAVMYQHWETHEMIEISVTDKIGPDVVSWTKFLKVVTGFWVDPSAGSFLVDVEKKIAVVFVLKRARPRASTCYQTAHVFGQDGYFKSVRIREAPQLDNTSSHRKRYYPLLVFSSYLPSLMQLNQPG